MSYRGKKFAEQMHSLEKKNLLQEITASTVCRGCGGSLYRYQKRKRRQWLLEQEEAKREEAFRILEAAATLRENARFYRLWCPEEVQRLEEQSDALLEKAEDLLTPVCHLALIYLPDLNVPALAERIRSGERFFAGAMQEI